MHALWGLLAIVAVALVTSIDDVYPIEVKTEHFVIAWTVELQDQQPSCRARVWIGHTGEQPISTLLSVDLDEEVAPMAEGDTPLSGPPAGTYS